MQVSEREWRRNEGNKFWIFFFVRVNYFRSDGQDLEDGGA